jgi:hypothetical protein
MINITKLLSLMEDATGITPQAFEINDIDNLPAMSYTIYRASNDGIKSVWRLQTRITANTAYEALTLDQQLSSHLTTVGDETKEEMVIEQNGGGTMREPALGLPQVFSYFDILVKE